MAVQRPYPQPGDLITADFFRTILDDLTEIEDRLAKLESGSGTTATGAPVLTALEPPNTVIGGALLALIGKNFAPISQARVRFRGEEISQFLPGSDDEHLIITVPAPAPDDKPEVAVSVETPDGTSKARTITVKPKVVVNAGKVSIDDATAPLNQIEEDETYSLQWRVRSETTLPETYALSLVFTDVLPAGSTDAWQAKASTNAKSRTIGPTEPFDLVAEITVPTGAKQATVQLKAASESGQFVKLSSPILLKVGDTPLVSNPGIQLTVSDPQPTVDPDGEANIVDLVTESDGKKIVRVPPKSTGYVEVAIEFKDPTPGRYSFVGELVDSPLTWQVGKARPGALIRSVAGGSTRVNYKLTNIASDSAKHSATLLAKAMRLKSDDTTEYVSFERITIENS
jgi:hypothetical protein